MWPGDKAVRGMGFRAGGLVGLSCLSLHPVHLPAPASGMQVDPDSDKGLAIGKKVKIEL